MMPDIVTPSIPLVVHLIYRLDFGGLETLLAECVNRMPADKYRHAIVCLTDYTEFSKKITRPDVEIYALHKAPGLGLDAHVRLWKLLRKLRPAILHTYNLAAIEYAFIAMLAGVPIRIHAEHGRTSNDPDGKNPKHNLLRRLMIPFIDCYVPVSGDLQRWLGAAIGVPQNKNLLINNGVDTERFRPDAIPAAPTGEVNPFAGYFVIGTVGRAQEVKNQQALVDAFIRLRALLPEQAVRLRLVIVGDGPLLPAIKAKVEAAGIADKVWLPGARSDIAALMHTFSVFTLPSIAEGTPVTILEAMAIGLPVVASRVGGIPEVVIDGETGLLVPPSDDQALAEALAIYCRAPEQAKRHGAAGRERIEHQYSMNAMLSTYAKLYDSLLETKINFRKTIKSCVE